MTIMEAAQKWKLSPNWIRELIKSHRVKAVKRDDVPVPFYDIPDGTPKPQSMQRSPARKGTSKRVKPESVARRAYRAAQVRKPVKKASAKAAPKKAKTA